MSLRQVVRIVRGQETSDGAGVRLKRSVGTGSLDHLDPFLLFDEFKSDRAGDYIAGFPDHPHRGFETVTYMLAGRMEHRDHAGNQGRLGPGSVQWMTAGRGIIHSEMPQQEDGLLWGFQLWVNLPGAHKMTAPRYQDIPPGDIPEYQGNGVRVRVVAGSVDEIRGPIRGIVTEPTYLDVRLDGSSGFTHPIRAEQNAFVYVYSGRAWVGASDTTTGTPLEEGSLGVLGEGDAVEIAAPEEDVGCLVIAGQPIGEPIARYGPFVMSTPKELEQAFMDYRNGTFLE